MRLVVLLPLCATAPACSAIVLRDAAAPAACASDDDCDADSLCEDGVCVDAAAGSLPDERVTIGEAGGVVDGPDGLSLTIPPAALDVDVPFLIERTSATLEYANFTPTAPLYRISPEVTFAAHASVAFDDDVEGTLFLRPPEPAPEWEPVARRADGSWPLARTGIFGIGEEIAP